MTKAAGPLLLLLLALASGGAASEDPDAWVARVGERTLTRRGLAVAAVQRVGQELLDMGSGPLTILRRMVEERVVAQEARRLGVGVTDEAVRRAYVELDRQVKTRTNGAKTLEEVIVREWKSTVALFLRDLRAQLLKEAVAGHEEHLGRTLPQDPERRIAQAEVVITTLLEKARVEYGVPTVLQAQPAPLAAEEIARVNGEPITRLAFGEELLRRLPTSRIKRILGEECKAALTVDVALSVEEMGAVIDAERARWNQWREMTTQEAYRTVSYEDYVRLRYGLDIESLQQDRYFRGLYGLVHRFREQVTAQEVRDEYERNRDGLYGASIRVTDVEIAFASGNPLVGEMGGRSRAEALRMAQDVLRRHHAGVPFDDIVREIAGRVADGRPDPTFRARRLRLRNTDHDRMLFERAQTLADGEVSAAFETLSEVHVMRREAALPAPAFAEVESMIREGLAHRRADAWLEERLQDESVVQMRWPPPEDG